MTQREEDGAGESAASGTPDPVAPAESSPWAPFARRAFRWLWIGVFISYIGTWMQTVGAQWLLVDAPNAATLVSLVQAANTLPVMLLALPGGVLADSFDRRWLLFTVQVYFFTVGILLTVLTVAGLMPPALLLAFTFAIAIGAAVQLPAWQSLIPELVPRTQLRAATRLEMVSVNLARAAGPALAGLVIAVLGVPVVFALNAFSVVFLAVALLLWRRAPAESDAPRERFVPALRAGGRYVWHEPVIRRILLRVMLFITPGMALWALLPLVASQRLGLGAAGYGALFGALGAGAIVAALVLGRLRNHVSTNGLLSIAGVLFAAAMVVVVLVPNFWAAMVVLVFAGLAWTAVISTLNAELQLFLPVWVRARGLAIYMVNFTGSMTVGALIWGLVAEGLGLQRRSLSRRPSCWLASSSGSFGGFRRPVTSTVSRQFTGVSRDWPLTPSRTPERSW
jgi:MFS family permease